MSRRVSSYGKISLTQRRKEIRRSLQRAYDAVVQGGSEAEPTANDKKSQRKLKIEGVVTRPKQPKSEHCCWGATENGVEKNVAIVR